MNKQSIQHLLQEHARARRTMQTLEVLLESLTQDPQWSIARAEAFDKIRDDLRRDLCRLIRKENKLLYPLLEPHFESDSGPLANLRDEHARLQNDCRALCEAREELDAGAEPAPILQKLQLVGRRTAEVLRDHFYKEERVLFPMVARLLTPEQDSVLLGKMVALEDSPAN